MPAAARSPRRPASSSPGVPSARGRPSAPSARTTSASGHASSARCSTRTIVAARAARKAARRPANAAAPAGSRLDVGSSRTSRPGRGASAPGERQALLLPARQARRPPALEPRQARFRQRHGNPRPHRRALPAPALQAEGDVVLDPLHHELGGRVLEHDPDPLDERRRVVVEDRHAVEPQVSRQPSGHGPRDEPGERPCQRALARARRADHEEAGPGRQVERDAGDGRLPAAGMGDRQVARDEPDRRPGRPAGQEQSGAQVGRSSRPSTPSRTPASRRARARKSEPPATITTPDTAISAPTTSCVAGSTPA